MPQTLINVHSFLQDFNPTKFTVYFSCLIFSILFSLRLDNKITISYWLVFLPLWIWKSLTILGASIGVIVWIRNPAYRQSTSSYVHFKSMLISLSLQLLLLMSELMICDNLENRRHSWFLAFVPIILTSLLSISVCAWSVRNGRSTELEGFAATNILQILFIALKLDNLLSWSWIVVFVPTWILLCFFTIILLYAMIFTAIVCRSPDYEAEGEHYVPHRPAVPGAPAFTLIFLPLVLFLVLLTSKLDTPPNVLTPGYFATCVPLFASLAILLHFSFGSRTGSLWWFGMRADFCTFLLSTCPCIKEFGNTSISVNYRQGDSISNSDQISNSTNSGRNGTLTGQSINEFENAERPNETSSNSEGGAKGLFHVLKRILFRDKSSPSNLDTDIENNASGTDEPIMKLNIDSPD